MSHVPVYILAGGRSRRFGSDKARAILKGEPLVKRVERLLMPVASRVTVVADVPEKYTDLGLRTIVDRTPGLGPLGGLDSAIADLEPNEHWLLLCCCDALVIHAAWLDQLLTHMRPGVRAAAYKGKFWQPMPALYARNCATQVEAQIASADQSLRGLLDQLTAIALQMPADWPKHWQANHPENLDEFQQAE